MLNFCLGFYVCGLLITLLTAIAARQWIVVLFAPMWPILIPAALMGAAGTDKPPEPAPTPPSEPTPAPQQQKPKPTFFIGNN